MEDAYFDVKDDDGLEYLLTKIKKAYETGTLRFVSSAFLDDNAQDTRKREILIKYELDGE